MPYIAFALPMRCDAVEVEVEVEVEVKIEVKVEVGARNNER